MTIFFILIKQYNKWQVMIQGHLIILTYTSITSMLMTTIIILTWIIKNKMWKSISFVLLH